jgi:hypothetical protein
MKLLIPSFTLAMSIAAAVPPTEERPVTDEYHGVKVVDDCRWLEKAGSPAEKTAQEGDVLAFLFDQRGMNCK